MGGMVKQTKPPATRLIANAGVHFKADALVPAEEKRERLEREGKAKSARLDIRLFQRPQRQGPIKFFNPAKSA